MGDYDIRIYQSIRDINPTDWRNLTHETPFSTYRWLDALERAAASPHYRYLIARDGREVAAAAVFQRGRRLTPSPPLNGLLAERCNVVEALPVAAYLSPAAASRVTHDLTAHALATAREDRRALAVCPIPGRHLDPAFLDAFRFEIAPSGIVNIANLRPLSSTDVRVLTPTPAEALQMALLTNGRISTEVFADLALAFERAFLCLGHYRAGKLDAFLCVVARGTAAWVTHWSRGDPRALKPLVDRAIGHFGDEAVRQLHVPAELTALVGEYGVVTHHRGLIYWPRSRIKRLGVALATARPLSWLTNVSRRPSYPT